MCVRVRVVTYCCERGVRVWVVTLCCASAVYVFVLEWLWTWCVSQVVIYSLVGMVCESEWLLRVV